VPCDVSIFLYRSFYYFILLLTLLHNHRVTKTVKTKARIIAPTIQESVKARFNAEELITKRATAKAVIAQSIANTLGTRNIVVETVFITDFKFSQWNRK
jgi:SPFH domain/Band 7 family protein